MPKREGTPIGAPIWIDLFTSDPAKSRAFYTELMGWASTEPNEAYGGYFSFLKGDSLVAGAMKNDGTSGVPDTWIALSAARWTKVLRNGSARVRPT